MSCHDVEILLDGYVDGELSPDERLRVQRHLADCAACRAAVDETRSLVAAASELPREISPARDLYPEIAERIERHDASMTTDSVTPRVLRVRWIGLAASLLIVTVGSTLPWGGIVPCPLPMSIHVWSAETE